MLPQHCCPEPECVSPADACAAAATVSMWHHSGCDLRPAIASSQVLGMLLGFVLNLFDIVHRRITAHSVCVAYLQRDQQLLLCLNAYGQACIRSTALYRYANNSVGLCPPFAQSLAVAV